MNPFAARRKLSAFSLADEDARARMVDAPLRKISDARDERALVGGGTVALSRLAKWYRREGVDLFLKKRIDEAVSNLVTATVCLTAEVVILVDALEREKGPRVSPKITYRSCTRPL